MDDFGDFSSFTPAGNTSNDISEKHKETTSGGGEQFSNVGISFDAFQGGLFNQGETTVGNDMPDLSDFGQFSGCGDNAHIAAGGVLFEIPPLPDDLDVENLHEAGSGIQFEIPPLPYSPTEENIHIAGGVPFEIPPIPDLPFGDNNDDTTENLSTVFKGVSSNGIGMQPRVTVPDPSVELGSERSRFPRTTEPEHTWTADFKNDPSSIHASSGSPMESFNPKTSTDTVNGSDVTTAAAGGDDFGEFGGFSGNSVITTAAGGNDFGEFGTATTAGGDDFGEFGGFSGNSVTTTTAGGDDFGEFGTATAAGGDDFGEFGGFSGNSVITTAAGGDDFGEFGGFSGNSMAATTAGDGFGEGAENAVTTTTSGSDDFGEFGGNSSLATTTAGGTTTMSGGDEFGEFSETPVATTMAGGDEFSRNLVRGSHFESFSGTPRTTTSGSGDDDKIGDFSGNPTAATSSATDYFPTSSNSFGDFSSVSFPTTQKEKSVNRTQNSFTPITDSQTIVKSSVESFSICFVKVVDSLVPSKAPSTSLSTLSKYLSKMPPLSEPSLEQTNNGTRDRRNPSMWLVLQSCLDLTIPLHKFNNSYLQSLYYTALSVDPMLISRSSTLSLLTGMVKFEAPLGGTTAVEDLRESFGFEGDLPQQPGSPTTEEGLGMLRKTSAELATALLDLSLPLTPKSPTRDSFTLAAELAGLDLNPQPQVDKLTSIQELLLNERLVVNRSTWMDSQLAELGRGGASQEEHTSTSPPHSATNTSNSLELQLRQLGLDVTKTTLPKSSGRELSLTARSVLGRLPDLSFMLVNDRLENSIHYSRGHS